jgi:hypothetical protein
MNQKIKELVDHIGTDCSGKWISIDNVEKLSELIVRDYAKKTIQGLMSDPAFVQAMDEHYENKWSHRFD